MPDIPQGFKEVSTIPQGFREVQPAEITQTPLELVAAGIPKPTTGGFIEKATGAAPSIASAVIGGTIGELAGLLSIPFDPAGARPLAERISSKIFVEPNSLAGQEGLQALAANPVIQAIEEIDKFARENLAAGGEVVGGDIGAALGDFLPSIVEGALGLRAITGAPRAARAADVATTAAERAAGGVAARVVQEAPGVARRAGEIAGEARTATTNILPGRRTAKDLIEAGELGDSRTARFLLTERGRITPDASARESIKQGFDEGVVAAIKAGSPADRKKMLDMVNIVQRGRTNARFSVTNRPSDVVGDSLAQRFNVVHQANRKAGRELDKVAKSLKGRSVDASEIGDQFILDLEDIGVQFNPQTNTVNFKGSDIEGLDAPEAAITRVLNRMATNEPVDAFDLHRLKKFIDESVTFGKTKEGLAGKTERILKGLRRNVDGLLDRNFAEYDRVNTEFSTTRGVIDDFQDAAGRKLDLTGPNAEKAIGTLSRRLMSNVQSRVNLLNSVDELDKLAKELTAGGKFPVILGQGRIPQFTDDILTQVLFVDELDKVFGPAARTSLAGDVGKRVEAGGRAFRSPTEATIQAVGAGVEAARGINPENAIKSIRELLKR